MMLPYKVRFQDSDWFEEHAWKDIDGEFWETEILMERLNAGEEMEFNWSNDDLAPAIPHHVAGTIQEMTLYDVTMKKWGIKAVYTYDANPEYWV